MTEELSSDYTSSCACTKWWLPHKNQSRQRQGCHRADFLRRTAPGIYWVEPGRPAWKPGSELSPWRQVLSGIRPTRPEISLNDEKIWKISESKFQSQANPTSQPCYPTRRVKGQTQHILKMILFCEIGSLVQRPAGLTMTSKINNAITMINNAIRASLIVAKWVSETGKMKCTLHTCEIPCPLYYSSVFPVDSAEVKLQDNTKC